MSDSARAGVAKLGRNARMLCEHARTLDRRFFETARRHTLGHALSLREEEARQWRALPDPDEGLACAAVLAQAACHQELGNRPAMLAAARAVQANPGARAEDRAEAAAMVAGTELAETRCAVAV